MEEEKVRLIELSRSWERRVPPIPPVAQTQGEIEARFAAVAEERRAVFEVIERRRDEAVQCLQSLVRIPSVNPSPEYEKPLATFVAQQMRGLGMEVEQIEPAPSRVSNLGRLPAPKGGGRSLLFYAHLDTVPVGDTAAWRYPPFEATVAEGRVWGRGAKDCKLGLAAALMALGALKEAGLSLQGELQLVTPADEERGGHWGIAQMVDLGMIKADWAIYGEGTPDRVTIGHRGWAILRLTTKGRSAHTAWKQQASNAILKMCRLAPAIDGLSFRRWQPHAVVPGSPVASLNIIEGGYKENVVPDRCSVTVDVRFPPGVTHEDVLGEVRQAIEAVRREEPDLGEVEVELVNLARPSFMHPQEPLVLYMSRAIAEVLGREPKAEGMLATSDSRWILLDAGVPIVNFSMGNDSGHQPNEWAGIQDLVDNVKIYTLMALLLLG